MTDIDKPTDTINRANYQTELDSWMTKQNTAIKVAEAALSHVHFVERQIDRLLEVMGIEEPKAPQMAPEELRARLFVIDCSAYHDNPLRPDSVV